MTQSQAMGVIQHTMVIGLKLAAPVLLISMVVGLIISIFQAATQIHEQTMTFVPKLIAIIVVLVALGPWMMSTTMDFVHYIFDMIVNLS